jgi:hypothetical protein
MAQAKFEINRDLYKELSLADAKLKSTIDFFEKKKMSSQERLFFKIWASDKLKIGVFDKGITVLKKDEVPLSAYAITLGSVECSDKEHSYELGPGSVIGLANGLAEIPSRYTITVKEFVNCKIIPIPNAARELQLTNTGLKGVCRMTLERILGFGTKIPDYMK